jgi:hypothetical protein
MTIDDDSPERVVASIRQQGSSERPVIEEGMTIAH